MSMHENEREGEKKENRKEGREKVLAQGKGMRRERKGALVYVRAREQTGCGKAGMCSRRAS